MTVRPFQGNEVRYCTDIIPKHGKVPDATLPYEIFFLLFYNLLTVDRVCRPLLAAYHRCLHLQSI